LLENFAKVVLFNSFQDWIAVIQSYPGEEDPLTRRFTKTYRPDQKWHFDRAFFLSGEGRTRYISHKFTSS